jgi:hypothetical protein
MAKYINNNWEKHRLPLGYVDEKVGKEIVFIKFRHGKREMIVMDKKSYKEKQKYIATFLMWLVLLCMWSVESIYVYQVTHNRVFWLFWLFLLLIILIMLLENLTNLGSGSQRRVMW